MPSIVTPLNRDSIKINLKETEWEGVDWNHLALNRNQEWALVNMVINLQILYTQGIS
jgi:hypothetical protein